VGTATIGATGRVSRHQSLLAAGELALATVICLAASVFDILPLSETPWLLLVGWISLRLRRVGWRGVGLVSPGSWRRAVLVSVAAAVVLQLLSTFVTEPILTALTGQSTDLSMFRPLVGNVGWLLVGLLVVWTLAAFGEELVYRGYILNRAADLGGRSRAAWIVALVCVSVGFGLGHLYQGPTGVVDSTVSGLLLGGLYLAFNRNLWIPILTHGFTDTIALFLVFFDLVPNVYR
jgi:membrane protease YdiL (CAAX protease family)